MVRYRWRDLTQTAPNKKAAEPQLTSNVVIQKCPNLLGKKQKEYLTMQFCHKFKGSLKCPGAEVWLFLNFGNKRSVREPRGAEVEMYSEVNHSREAERPPARPAPPPSFGARGGDGQAAAILRGSASEAERGPAPASQPSAADPGGRLLPQRGGGGNGAQKQRDRFLISVGGEGWRKGKQKRAGRRGSRPSGF